MTAAASRYVRFVTLTLLGSAAIVPALLVRRMLDARAVMVQAEKHRAEWIQPGPVGPGAASNDATDAASRAEISSVELRQVEKAIAIQQQAPSNLLQPRAVRFFTKDEIDPNARPASRTTGGSNDTNRESKPAAPLNPEGAAAKNALVPPVQCTADATDRGVLVTWRDNPAMPTGAIVKSQIYRWSDTEAPAPVHETQPYSIGAPSRGDSAATPECHTFLDRTVCDGLQYSYGVRAIQLDRLEGVEVRRSALGDRAVVSVPIRYRFEVVGFAPVDPPPVGRGPQALPGAPESRHAVVLLVFDLKENEPKGKAVMFVPAQVADVPEAAGPGGRESQASPNAPMADSRAFRELESFDSELGFETGWRVVRVEREMRDEVVDTLVPVFNADGSRKIENGVAVTESRAETQRNAYPVVRLRNRCGSEQILKVTPRKVQR